MKSLASLLLMNCSYDNDESAPSKDQIVAQISVPEPAQASEGPGYGEEPDAGPDPTSFENETSMQEDPTNGSLAETGGDSAHDFGRDDEPGIRMKEDG